MDKLELKDIAPYLPHDLKVCTSYGSNKLNKAKRMMGADVDRLRTSKSFNMFPLLRPMSDLTREITHNWETFVPLHRILESYCFNLSEMDEEYILSFKESLIDVDISYKTVQMLCEWQIDFQDLIGRGLAINLNEVDNGK
ncbi:hypothetical protein [Elizabethkingia meningoseptica]|uniref:hypothetical protein n=1 Tax=Elizabethkingia meningoseptica TaxID=238 RepID=UPI0023B0D125|nr:hypothetical protein [Elizabethkingia meningoseptica]MDE5526643.1 hypothetical protein [Elizabethkingia meningoseptica]